jgi:hypothetical protein
MLHILGGFLICQYPKDLRFKYFMNFMISMVVFRCLKKNLWPSSSKRPHKPFPFMVLQCKFVDKGYIESSIFQKISINKSMHIMICISNIPKNVNKRKY